MSVVRCDECDQPIDLAIDPNCFGEFGKAEETLCENCRQNKAEAAWERHCEDFHDGGCTRFNSLAQQQAEARRFK